MQATIFILCLHGPERAPYAEPGVQPPGMNETNKTSPVRASYELPGVQPGSKRNKTSSYQKSDILNQIKIKA